MKIVREKLNEVRGNSLTNDGFFVNIESATKSNSNFRKVLYTAKNIQLVLMTLKPGEDIGMETHKSDQFFRFESGKGKVIINKKVYKVGDGSAIIVPAGSKHNIKNVGGGPLTMYTLYAPPHHADGVTHTTKKEAKMSDEHWKGKTTEKL